MPSLYAHYRFGKELCMSLPEPARTYALRYRELFDLGLQGPDILFFYHPFYHNYVNTLGYQIHDWKGRKFFQAALRTIRNRRNRGAAIAYITGVACHYALDLSCHPYIESLVRYEHKNHCAIEGAFERHLIVEEDHLPPNYLVTGSIKINPENAMVVRQFYGKTTGKQIRSAVYTMKLCNDALRMRNNHPLKRFLFFILRLLGKYNNIAGMVITPEPQPEYKESNRILRMKYDEAKPVALALISELLTCIQSGEPLGRNFNPTFSG